MAMLHPNDRASTEHRSDRHERTTKPRLCLLAGFAFMVTTAVAFHYAFNALI